MGQSVRVPARFPPRKLAADRFHGAITRANAPVAKTQESPMT